MMNRAEQNWPNDEVIVIANEIADEYRKQALFLAGLAPYAHELNTSGTDCAVDCPACKWVVESNLEVR